MATWPFKQRGGMAVVPFQSNDPVVCAHQAVRLKHLLAEVLGRYEETCMVLNRLEIVYICAGRMEDADRVHADKLALVPPTEPEEEPGMVGRFKWWWHVQRHEARFTRGQLAVDQNLSELHRLAPWESDQDTGAVRRMA
jgi:hypothetical protein